MPMTIPYIICMILPKSMYMMLYVMPMLLNIISLLFCSLLGLIDASLLSLY